MHPQCYIGWNSPSNVMHGVTTIDAHRSAGTALVDVHTHAIDQDLPDLRQVYPDDRWPTVERTSEMDARLMFGGVPYRRIDHRCWSADARLADMDREGVAVQVLSPIPVTFCYQASAAGAAELASAQNEFFAGIVRAHPTRFAALAAVALQDPDRAVDEMRRCMGRPGFLGVEIGTQVGGTELADPSLDRFFAVAHELGALVLVHPSDQDLSPRVTGLGLGFGAGMPIETAVAAAALITSGALSRRPAVRICLAHGGGVLPALIGRLDKGAIIAGVPHSPEPACQPIVVRLVDLPPICAAGGHRRLWSRPRRFRIRLPLPGDAAAHRRHRAGATRRPVATDMPHQSGGIMAQFLGLGLTHYPLLAGTDEHMASLLRWTLADPDIPDEAKDPANWPAPMRAEWGTDNGVAAAAHHRKLLVENLARCRDALDEFAPDVMVVWGDDQYENFREEVIPPFCVLAYGDVEVDPFEVMTNRGSPNAWGLPDDTTMTLHGDAEGARGLADQLLERGFDVAYSYQKRTNSPFPHAIANTQLFLDYPNAGRAIPLSDDPDHRQLLWPARDRAAWRTGAVRRDRHGETGSGRPVPRAVLCAGPGRGTVVRRHRPSRRVGRLVELVARVPHRQDLAHHP